jgi:virulence-associated protein VagC
MRRSEPDSISPARANRARLFWNGRSQAVRLPKEFRFDGDEVEIRRDGDAVILEPVKKRQWPEGYWERMEQLAADLDVGDVQPFGARFLDVDVDDE